ncbi:MAG: hypothetical protein ABI633_00535 [Burkholderiales bacterium]
MKSCFIPWADVAFDQLQAYQRVAYFMLGCIEREQLLTLQALGAFWLYPPGDSLNARPAATTSPSLPASRVLAKSANDSTCRLEQGAGTRVA